MSSHGFITRVSATPDALAVEWADGTHREFAGIWLRDNAPEHRDPHSGQRLVDIADLPATPRIRSAAAHNGAVTRRMGRRVARILLRCGVALCAGRQRSNPPA